MVIFIVRYPLFSKETTANLKNFTDKFQMKILKSVFLKLSEININYCSTLYHGESGQELLKTIIIQLAVTTEFKWKI